MDNYANNIEVLDQRVVGRFIDIPGICDSLGEHFEDSENTISDVSFLQIPTDHSSKEAYNLWNQVFKCVTLYRQSLPVAEQIKADIRKYFSDRYYELLWSGWWKEGRSAGIKREDDFVVYYENRLLKKYPKQMKRLEQARRYNESLSAAEQKIWNHFYDLDRTVFLKRTKGKELCEQDVCSFILEYTYGTPNDKCIYPNGGVYLIASGALSSNVLGSLFGGLAGELRWNLKMYNLIFVFKNTFKDPPYVSGDQLRGSHYVYSGVYTYQTVLGNMNSVHSFKEFDLKKATNGLYFYGKRRER